MKKTVAILGAGNMGLAITDGILASEELGFCDIILVRRSVEKLSEYKDRGCTVTCDAVQASEQAEVLILAVKPQMMQELLSTIAPVCRGKLVISIAAGVKIESIESMLPNCKVVRAMPNTPLTVGAGVTELCRGASVSDEDFAFAKKLFECSGACVECSEKDINAFTALTSSAVAYFAAVEEAMCKWAEKNGLSHFDRQTLCDLISKTQEGTAKLLYEKKMPPAELIRAVASPKGTTERALLVFEEQDLEGIFDNAMTACLKRADELSRIK